MLTLAVNTYDRQGLDPRELASTATFPSRQALEEFLISQIIPVAFQNGEVLRDPEDRLTRADAKRVRRADASAAYLTEIALQMGESHDLKWWRIRQWLPWMPPSVLGFLFMTSIGVIAACLGGVRAGLALGVPSVFTGSLAAGTMAWAATSRGHGEIKGTKARFRVRLAVSFSIGVLFGLCLATARALDAGAITGSFTHVGLGAGLGLIGGLTLGVLALHDGPLVAEARLPSELDILFSLPIGLTTGLTYGLVAWSWLGVAVGVIASVGFMLGVAWTRPSERPQEGATPASSFEADLRGGALLGVAIGATVTATLALVLQERHGTITSVLGAAAVGAVLASLTGAAASQACALTLVTFCFWVRGRAPFLLLTFAKLSEPRSRLQFWKRAGFLEEARERDVLRCVGTVYQFRHARLQDQLRGVIGIAADTSVEDATPGLTRRSDGKLEIKVTGAGSVGSEAAGRAGADTGSAFDPRGELSSPPESPLAPLDRRYEGSDTLSVELLSVHNSMDEFDSGHSESNLLAHALVERVRARDVDDLLAIVVADASGRVVGILATTDVYLTGDMQTDGGLERTQADGKCLFYYLLAVTVSHQNGYVLRLLLDEIEAIRARKLGQRNDYIAELAAPLRGHRAVTTGLTHLLERHGFRKLDDRGFWFRPRQDGTY